MAYLNNKNRVIVYPSQFDKSALGTSELILEDKLDYAVKCKRYLRSSFLGLSEEKLKADAFDGPQIRQLIIDEDFINSMSEPEECAWRTFVVRNFLGNRKAENYEELVSRPLGSY